MAISGTQIVRGAYRLMGRPSQDDIRYQDVLDNARDVIRGRLLDLKMANRNRTAEISAWVATSTKEEDVSSFVSPKVFIIPVKMQFRYKSGSATQVPHPVEFVALETIDEVANSSRAYAAIYNNDTKIAFSDSATTLAQKEYRLIYESLGDVDMDELSDTTESFPDLFTTLCEYETAWMTINQVDNDSESWMLKKERLSKTIEPVFLKWNERFETWQKSRFGNRKVYKKGASRNRYSRRSVR